MRPDTCVRCQMVITRGRDRGALEAVHKDQDLCIYELGRVLSKLNERLDFQTTREGTLNGGEQP